MDVNSLPKTVTRQCRGCDLYPGSSMPESSALTTRLPSHPFGDCLTVMCCINARADYNVVCVSELVVSSSGKARSGVTALQRQREREEQRRLKHERARQRRKKKNNPANSQCFVPSVMNSGGFSLI